MQVPTVFACGFKLSQPGFEAEGIISGVVGEVASDMVIGSGFEGEEGDE